VIITIAVEFTPPAEAISKAMIAIGLGHGPRVAKIAVPRTHPATAQGSNIAEVLEIYGTVYGDN
jgi:hypothetical protein